MTARQIPTVHDWAGGGDKFRELTRVFYEKVRRDALLEPVFRHMSPTHAEHVAAFLAESFGGEKRFTAMYGEQSMVHVVGKHLDRHLTEAHRRRWVELILQSADEIGMPSDPEFRGVLAGHLEWGTRFAVLMSGQSENPMTAADRVPQFGWGDFGGPFGYGESVFRRPAPDGEG